jgi:GNAT superfamily N-acetyltransferase
MNLTIRRMENEEIERIRDIDRSEVIRTGYRQKGREIVAFDVNWDDGGWLEGDGEHSFGQMIRGARRQLDLGGTAFGAFDGDRLAGIAIYRPRLTPSMGQLALLHVSGGYRRQGVASHLYDEVARMAHADGATQLYVSATPTESAVSFYKSKGFEPTDSPHPELLAEEPDDIHMVLAL